MITRFVTPKYESVLTAVVLSANDVVATVLILDVDEGGYAIKTVAEVDLPFQARNYRQKHPDGLPMFQRGDLITIRCQIEHDQEQLSDEDIEQMLESLHFMDDENAEFFEKVNERHKEFAKDWRKICEKDLAKRVKEVSG